MAIFINAISAQTPCLIGVDRFINFTSLGTVNCPHNEIVDISAPTQWSNNYLYVGAKGEPYTLNFTAWFFNPVTAHQWKWAVAESTGQIYDIYDYWGNRNGLQILKQFRITSEKTRLNVQTAEGCFNGAVLIEGDLSIIPHAG